MSVVLIEICFVLSGFVTSCVSGYVYTEHPHLVKDVAPIVYMDETLKGCSMALSGDRE